MWLFLTGVIVTLLGVACYLVRDELVHLPYIWGNEPDNRLRTWFAFTRRVVTGYVIDDDKGRAYCRWQIYLVRYGVTLHRLNRTYQIGYLRHG